MEGSNIAFLWELMISIILLGVILYGLRFIRFNPMVSCHLTNRLEGILRIIDRHDVSFLFLICMCTFVYVSMDAAEAKLVF